MKEAARKAAKQSSSFSAEITGGLLSFQKYGQRLEECGDKQREMESKRERTSETCLHRYYDWKPEHGGILWEIVKTCETAQCNDASQKIYI